MSDLDRFAQIAKEATSKQARLAREYYERFGPYTRSWFEHYGNVLLGAAVVLFVCVPWWLGAAVIWNWLF